MSSLLQQLLGGSSASGSTSDTGLMPALSQGMQGNMGPLMAPLSGMLNTTQPGTLQNAFGNLLQSSGLMGNPTNVGSAISTNPTPISSQTQVNLQPTTVSTPNAPSPSPAAPSSSSPYSQPTAIPDEAIPSIRNAILTSAGQIPLPASRPSGAPAAGSIDPALADPNSLMGRMNSPNSNVDMQAQGKQATSVSNSFRHKSSKSYL